MILCWVYRDRPWIGAIVGLMVVLKITPIVFVVWLVGQANWRALVWCAGAIAVGLVVGIAGASSIPTTAPISTSCGRPCPSRGPCPG